MTPNIHRDLKEFLLSLKRHGVRFVVGGSYVMAVLGRPRHTQDLDVLVEPTKANAKRLSTALRAFGYVELAKAAGHREGGCDQPKVTQKYPLANGKSYTHELSCRKIKHLS